MSSEVSRDFEVFMTKVVETMVNSRKEEIQKDLWERLSEKEKDDITRAFYSFCITKSEKIIRESWSLQIRGIIRQVVETQIRKVVATRLEELNIRSVVAELATAESIKESILVLIDSEIESFRSGVRSAIVNVKTQLRNVFY